MLVLEGAGQKADRQIDIESVKKNSGLQLDDATLSLDGVTRQFSIYVVAADTQTRQINVRLEVKTPKENSPDTETSSADFWVGYFDFPMIDNTRLTHDQRAAIILNNFEDGAADITLAYFPGSYSSLKEKASYQEVFQNLVKTNENLLRKR